MTPSAERISVAVWLKTFVLLPISAQAPSNAEFNTVINDAKRFSAEEHLQIVAMNILDSLPKTT